MATINAINYLKHKEDQRSHLAQEKETKRANLAREFETNRSNLVNEQLGRDTLAETNRSNLAREVETNRTNLAKEVETNRANLAKERETNRHNLVAEGIDAKVGNSNIYKNEQQGNLLNAQAARADMENAEIAALGQTGVGYDVLNKEQQIYKTLFEAYAKEQEGKLKSAQAATEGTKAATQVVSSVGSFFKGLGSALKK